MITIIKETKQLLKEIFKRIKLILSFDFVKMMIIVLVGYNLLLKLNMNSILKVIVYVVFVFIIIIFYNLIKKY